MLNKAVFLALLDVSFFTASTAQMFMLLVVAVLPKRFIIAIMNHNGTVVGVALTTSSLSCILFVYSSSRFKRSIPDDDRFPAENRTARKTEGSNPPLGRFMLLLVLYALALGTSLHQRNSWTACPLLPLDDDCDESS